MSTLFEWDKEKAGYDKGKDQTALILSMERPNTTRDVSRERGSVTTIVETPVNILEKTGVGKSKIYKNFLEMGLVIFYCGR